MKLSDYVANFLEVNNVGACFMVSGGAVLHLIDSIDRNSNIPIICSQHEQAASTGADAYSRVSKEKMGLVMATSGPGATNLVTGISNAFFDSIPLICITGQVSTFRSKPIKSLRQYGFQETDVVDIFRSITKFAVKLESPDDIKFILEKAFYLAKTGRPGPVLIDIPDDFQRVDVNPTDLKSYFSSISRPSETIQISGEVSETINSYISKSQKPLLVLGSGIRLSSSESIVQAFVEKLNIPFVTTWGGKDLIPSNHPLNLGTFGVCGPRPGNWAISECDLVIVLGARLNQMQAGGNLSEFAPHAKKIMIDIEISEIKKFEKSSLKIDYGIEMNLSHFIREIVLAGIGTNKWHSWTSEIVKEYSIISEHLSDEKEISAYKFVNYLSNILDENTVLITDAGGNLCWTMQAFNVKANQQLFSSWNHSPMGFSLPASIGASLANTDIRVNCIIGDGGLMMCLSELGTIARHNIPVNIFIFNNRGHGIQKQTINTWLGGNMVGVDHNSGLFFPDFEDISKGFGIPYKKIETLELAKGKINLEFKGPIIYDVMINPEQTIFPMLKFGGNLKDLDDSIAMPQFDLG
jgi:acetolactate synthase-1/2/3 large subunit